jgi:hypothetical protein
VDSEGSMGRQARKSPPDPVVFPLAKARCAPHSRPRNKARSKD